MLNIRDGLALVGVLADQASRVSVHHQLSSFSAYAQHIPRLKLHRLVAPFLADNIALELAVKSQHMLKICWAYAYFSAAWRSSARRAAPRLTLSRLATAYCQHMHNTSQAYTQTHSNRRVQSAGGGTAASNQLLHMLSISRTHSGTAAGEEEAAGAGTLGVNSNHAAVYGQHMLRICKNKLTRCCESNSDEAEGWRILRLSAYAQYVLEMCKTHWQQCWQLQWEQRELGTWSAYAQLKSKQSDTPPKLGLATGPEDASAYSQLMHSICSNTVNMGAVGERVAGCVHSKVVKVARGGHGCIC